MSAENDDTYPETQHRGAHHMRPRSRCSQEKKESHNTYPMERWPSASKKHDYWHILFANLTPQEAIDKIRKYTKADGSVREGFFTVFFWVDEKGRGMGIKTDDVRIRETCHVSGIEQRKKAWQVVFGEMNAYEAVEWIKREFIDKEWLPEELERRKAEKEFRKRKWRNNAEP